MTFRLSEQSVVWTQQLSASPTLLQARKHVQFLAAELFHEYLPAATDATFLSRLDEWLGQARDIDRQLMLELVTHIFFVGLNEFQSLYLAAHRGPITQWLLDQAPMSLEDPGLSAHLEDAIRRTWFCPISDSMDIHSFHMVNRITVRGHGARPNWHGLQTTLSRETQEAVAASFSAYMREHGLERVVLLEDFVGSGEQLAGVLGLHSEMPNDPPTLIVPLVACPDGSALGRRIDQSTPSITYRPVVDLPPSVFVTDTLDPAAPASFSQIRALAIRLSSVVYGGTPPDTWHPLGFPASEPTGGLVVLRGNCPDNTLPMIHHESGTWKPLFRRNQRVN